MALLLFPTVLLVSWDLQGLGNRKTLVVCRNKSPKVEDYGVLSLHRLPSGLDFYAQFLCIQSLPFGSISNTNFLLGGLADAIIPSLIVVVLIVMLMLQFLHIVMLSESYLNWMLHIDVTYGQIVLFPPWEYESVLLLSINELQASFGENCLRI